MIKKLFFVFLIFLSMNVVYSVEVDIGDNDDLCFYNINEDAFKGCHENFDIGEVSNITGYWPGEEDFRLVTWKDISPYLVSSPDFKLRSSTKIPYRTPSTASNYSLGNPGWEEADLDGDICSLDINQNGDDLEFSSSLKELNVNMNNQSILEKYYYMKNFVVIEVTNKSDDVVDYILPEEAYEDYDSKKLNKYEYKDNENLIEDVIRDPGKFDDKFELDEDEYPYILTKPEEIELSLGRVIGDYCENKSPSCNSPNYNFEIKTIPIDGKCDFNDDDELEMSKDVKLNNISFDLNNEVGGTSYGSGSSFLEIIIDALMKYYFSDPNTTSEKLDDDNDGVIDSYEFSKCVGEKGRVFFGGCKKPELDSSGDIILPSNEIFDKFRNLEINESREEAEFTDLTKNTNKLIYNYEEEKYYFVDSNDNKFQLDDDFSFRKLLNVEDGDGNVKGKDMINPDNYMLDMFRIRSFSNKEEVEEFVNNSKQVMNDTNITKKEKDLTGGKKEVEIQLKNLSTSQGTTMYLIFEKDTPYEDIIPKDSTGDYFVQEKDPIIGWYFNGSEDEGSSSYEVPEDSDATVVLTHEPILFNEGELIVNYRNNNCINNETELFQLDSLEGSNIYSKGDNTFKVCLAHIREDVGNITKYSNSIHVGNITSDNNFTREKTGTKFGASIDKAKNQNYVWDMKVQKENPNGNYSCVGSFDNDEKFGDCSYEPNNRVWLHFGIDTIAPNTTIDIPVLSHTLYINFNIEEKPIYGSDLNRTNYCITDSSNICDPSSGKSRELSGTQDSFRIQESCETDTGCRKKLRYYSVDNFGNKEDTKEYDLNIIDKASSCQESCLSVPSPDRYLKECNGVNSCRFYEDADKDGGEPGSYVANLCDLEIKDTWVNYNGTHEIQCPDGPIKETSMTNQNLDVQGESCNIIRTFPYPIVFNGKSMIMNIISCIA